MASTQRFQVELSEEMAARVRERVASGRFASEAEVIREGLRVLDDREATFEQWLRNEVIPASEALEADPGRALTIEEVRASLAEERKRRRDVRS